MSDGEPAPEDESLEPEIPEGYLVPPDSWSPGIGHYKYDWPTIRARYVEGYLDGEKQCWPTLTDVAEHFGANYQMVRERSGKEGWRERRAKWQAQMDAERQQLKAQRLAKEADELDTSALNVSKLGVGLVYARLQEIAQVANDARKRQERTGINSRELDELARAADLLHRIGLRALGDPDSQRLEISGSIDITHELRRDDPDRLAQVLSVLHAAGIDVGIEGADPEGGEPWRAAAIEVGR